MTPVGKIFVIANLVFSVVVGGMVLVIYMTERRWEHEYNEQAAKLTAANASNQAYQDEMKKVVDYVQADAALSKAAGISPDEKPDEKLKKVTLALQNATKTIDALQKDVEQKSKDLIAEQDKSAKDDAVVSSSKAELDIRQKEVADMRDRLKKQSDDIAKMLKDLNKAKDESVSAQLLAKGLQDRNQQLEKEKDQLAHDNLTLVANKGSTTALKPGPNAPNPPAENIEGKIMEVGASGLVRLSIGSDAGLAKNHTLEVYRLNEQSPDQSRYLGRIKIVEVSPTEAVAQPVGKPLAPFQYGDTVGSHILGG